MQDYIWNDLMAQGNNLDCMDINVDSIYTMDLSLSRFTFGLELVFFFFISKSLHVHRHKEKYFYKLQKAGKGHYYLYN